MADEDEVLALAGREFLKLESAHSKSGYRDGATEGHQDGLQGSFDQGFINGVTYGVIIGRLLGSLNALKVQEQKKDQDITSIEELIKEIESHNRSRPSEVQYDDISTAQTLETLLETTNPPRFLQHLQTKYTSIMTKYANH